MKQNNLIIYDFDGTLTPHSLPQYQVLKNCGYDDVKMINEVKEIIMKNGVDLCDAYIETFKKILEDNNIEFNKQNICLGSNDVTFNKGIIEYFEHFQFKNTGIKHFVVTSGFAVYVENTPINVFLNGVYGTTLNSDNGVDRIVSDQEKAKIIQEIQKQNNVNNNKIIYFGDGLTDQKAFEYVHSIGGKNVFVCAEGKENKNYQKLNKLGIIDKCFNLDFSKNSEIYNYIENVEK